MLTFKALQVIAVTPVSENPYDMTSRGGSKGVSIYGKATVLGSDGSVAVVKVKGKTTEEATEKLKKFVVGKPLDFAVREAETTQGVFVLSA